MSAFLLQVEFVAAEEGSRCAIAQLSSAQEAAASLGCAPAALERALTERTLFAGGTDVVAAPLSAKDAEFARDSLAKVPRVLLPVTQSHCLTLLPLTHIHANDPSNMHQPILTLIGFFSHSQRCARRAYPQARLPFLIPDQAQPCY